MRLSVKLSFRKASVKQLICFHCRAVIPCVLYSSIAEYQKIDRSDQTIAIFTPVNFPSKSQVNLRIAIQVSPKSKHRRNLSLPILVESFLVSSFTICYFWIIENGVMSSAIVGIIPVNLLILKVYQGCATFPMLKLNDSPFRCQSVLGVILR